MSSLLFCDRCKQEIKPGDELFSGQLPVYEKRNVNQYLDTGIMKNSILASKITNECKDLCMNCMRSFLNWWDKVGEDGNK